MARRLVLSGVGKSFTMHLRGGVRIEAVADISFSVAAGECVALSGPSGAGKSSILKTVYGNYGVDRGSIRVAAEGGWMELAGADPRTVLALRRTTIGYVSQFLRAVPRVAAADVVAEPLVARGVPADEARGRAQAMLGRLNLPPHLWPLPPATFSGGEQQRVNVARGFITDHPILLLDEPSASLDATNKAVVSQLIREKKAAGVALLGIFHDLELRDAVADRVVEIAAPAARPAAA